MNNLELIIIAPTQIKRQLSVGNIYDLTIADFYAKCRKFANVDIYMPFLWNINGEPLVKQMREDGYSVDGVTIEAYVSSLIARANKKMEDHYINFDGFIRDDHIQGELNSLLTGRYADYLVDGDTYINECIVCKNIFGSDPSIKICKICGSNTIFRGRKTFFKKIKRSTIEDKIKKIKFYPDSLNEKLLDFLNYLPDEYDLILEKNREYTLNYDKYKLDPRFITMLLPAIINDRLQKKVDNIIYIHGDVVKKFDYYSICYLENCDLPSKVVSHGVIVDKENKKIRWQDDDGEELEIFKIINNKILRAYFLSHNIVGNLMFDKQNVQGQVKGLTKLYIKIKKILSYEGQDNNSDKDMRGVIIDFHNKVGDFKLAMAFDCMQKYTEMCWKKTKDGFLSLEEKDNLIKFRDIYFGK